MLEICGRGYGARGFRRRRITRAEAIKKAEGRGKKDVRAACKPDVVLAWLPTPRPSSLCDAHCCAPSDAVASIRAAYPCVERRGPRLHTVWRCFQWGLPSRDIAAALVRSYRTGSPLPKRKAKVKRQKEVFPAFCLFTFAFQLGGMFSVALSVVLLRLAVSQHCAL